MLSARHKDDDDDDDDDDFKSTCSSEKSLAYQDAGSLELWKCEMRKTDTFLFV